MNWKFWQRKNKSETEVRSGWGDFNGSPLQNTLGLTNQSNKHKITNNLKGARGASRHAASVNPYAARAIQLSRINTLGSGLRLSLRHHVDFQTVTLEDLKAIENLFWEAGKSITVDGRHTFKSLLELIERTELVDGECFIRLYKTDEGIKCQVLESDQVDETINRELPGGSFIANGIEMNQFGKVTGYHVRTSLDDYYIPNGKTVFIPAEEIIHVFRQESASAVRGFPYFNSSLSKLQWVDQFQDAHLLASKKAAVTDSWLEAADMGFGDVPQVPFELGSTPVIPAGLNLKFTESPFPSAEHATVIKSSLRGAAAGMNLSYNKLAGDFESVSYSSLREDKLLEKAHYKRRREFIIEKFCTVFFNKWAAFEQELGNIPAYVELSELDDAAVWSGDGWEWVDPLKDAQAIQLQLQLGLVTPSEALQELGKDFRDHLSQLKQDKALMEEFGITIGQLAESIKPDNTAE
ncbi:phage portal protein [Novispirillum itersonii]|uniref:phage portal protein n=1 Tax=Novispirillum itersonii TaxID=189 RepID=UPI0003A4D93C|nr:phage portal protein [Novispirillum itersonii]